MKKISFEGALAKYLTFRKAESASVKEGDFVSLSADGDVCEVKKGEIFGKCVDVCGSLVTVQVKGYMTAPLAAGQTVTPGRVRLGIENDGNVKVDTSAAHVLVLSVDTAKSEIGFIL